MIWTPEFGGMEIVSLAPELYPPEIGMRILPRFEDQVCAATKYAPSTEILRKMPIVFFFENLGFFIKTPLDEDGERRFLIGSGLQPNVDLELPYHFYKQGFAGQYEGKVFIPHLAVASANGQFIANILLNQRQMEPKDRIRIVDYWVTAETVAGE